MIAHALIALVQSASAADVDWISPFLNGDRALERGDARAALVELTASSRILPDHPQTAWLAAGAHARLGERDAAFAELRACVERGGGDAALLAWDPDLASLREDARYAELLEVLRSRAADPALAWTSELATRVEGYAISLGPRGERVAIARWPHALLLDGLSGEVVSALERPGESSTSAVVSPDGRWVVVSGTRDADRSKYLRVHDAQAGDLAHELEPAGWQPRFSADSRRLYVGAHREVGAVWRTDDWAREKPITFIAEQAAIAPSGDRLLLRTGSEAVLWDVDAGAVMARHDAGSVVSNATLGFSADGALAYFLEGTGTCLRVIDGRNGADLACIRPSGPSAPGAASGLADPAKARFTSAAIVGVSGEIATIDARRHVRVWDARTAVLRREFPTGAGDEWPSISAAPDGRTLLVGGYHSELRALDSRTGSHLWTEGQRMAAGATFSPDGMRVGYSDWNVAPTTRDARNGEIVARVDTLTPLRPAIVADRRADALWIGGSDGTVRRIDAATGRRTTSWKPGDARIVQLALSGDGARLAALDAEGVTRIVRAETGVVEGTVVRTRSAGTRWEMSGIGFTPAGDALVVTSPVEGLRVVAAPDWTTRCTMRVEKPRWSSCFDRDGGRLLVAAEGGLLHVLDTRTGEPARAPIAIPGEIEEVALAPNGRVWVGTDSSAIHVVDLAQGRSVREIGLGRLDFAGFEVGSITFRDDGELAIVASSGFGVVAGFDPRDGRLLWSYEYNGGNPGALQSGFDASGERVYVWGQGVWSSRIVDARSGALLVDLSGRFDALLPIGTGEHFVATSRDGLHGVRARDGALLWTRTDTVDDGWVVSTRGRYCDGTPDALARVHLVTEDGSLPLDALAATLLDPKRVRAAAEGVDVAPPPPPVVPRLVQLEPRERVAAVVASAESGTCAFEAECVGGVRGFEVVVDGRARFEAGEPVDATHRRLSISVPVGIRATSVRCRAIGTDGTRSRAAHTTFERR